MPNAMVVGEIGEEKNKAQRKKGEKASKCNFLQYKTQMNEMHNIYPYILYVQEVVTYIKRISISGTESTSVNISKYMQMYY